DVRYHTLRPKIAIARPGASSSSSIKLDDTFALHPALAPLAPRFRDGSLAIVHGVGSSDPTRSHFDAQDYVESGTPGVKATADGWLNRALGSEETAARKSSALRAVALQPNLPRMLRGDVPALAMSSLSGFGVHPFGSGKGASAPALQSA